LLSITLIPTVVINFSKNSLIKTCDFLRMWICEREREYQILAIYSRFDVIFLWWLSLKEINQITNFIFFRWYIRCFWKCEYWRAFISVAFLNNVYIFSVSPWHYSTLLVNRFFFFIKFKFAYSRQYIHNTPTLNYEKKKWMNIMRDST